MKYTWLLLGLLPFCALAEQNDAPYIVRSRINKEGRGDFKMFEATTYKICLDADGKEMSGIQTIQTVIACKNSPFLGKYWWPQTGYHVDIFCPSKEDEEIVDQDQAKKYYKQLKFLWQLQQKDEAHIAQNRLKLNQARFEVIWRHIIDCKPISGQSAPKISADDESELARKRIDDAQGCFERLKAA